MLAAAVLLAACATSTTGHPQAALVAPTSPAASPSPTTSSVSPTSSKPSVAAAAPKATVPAPRPSTTHAAAVAGLPLAYSTGNATQVITATAPSLGSTSGTLQAWQRTSAGWQRVGPATSAWFGSQGLTEHMSEWISATPVGSFTLTQAFGSQPDPGTALPYFQTTPADWWISNTFQPDAKVYNTHQRCASNCAFDVNPNDPKNANEHLYYSQPYYRYAVVIDYNTANAPGGIRVGAGSAVFLHVTVHAPTEGCVAIDEDRLVAIMHWLSPSAHPRILVGVA